MDHTDKILRLEDKIDELREKVAEHSNIIVRMDTIISQDEKDDEETQNSLKEMKLDVKQLEDKLLKFKFFVKGSIWIVTGLMAILVFFLKYGDKLVDLIK